MLAPACISTDHPGYLSFIPASPTEASSLFDLVVSASSIYGGSWLEGSGAIYAENQVLDFLAREVGLPSGSGGVFVQGGTLGNLSALVTAREWHKARLAGLGISWNGRFKVLVSEESHSSLKASAKVMDLDLEPLPVDERGSLRGATVEAALSRAEPGEVCAVVGTAGTTNFGIVDDLEGIALAAKAHDVWYHVDGAYGLAGALDHAAKPLFKGMEHADSFIVDPHKWLFAPFDACALVYRNPELAYRAHAQHGEYLEHLADPGVWNPSDYAFNLTRRVRGLPLWFSMASHGVASYREAIAKNIELAAEIAADIKTRSYLRLVREPQLSVVVFERLGWELADYRRWSDALLASGMAFVVPSSHGGRPNLRFAIVNPLTDFELLRGILDSLEA